jgi:hypothetical protein
MLSGPLCPECGERSTFAGNDERGTIYLCETPDSECVVFDHWRDDVRTYRGSHRSEYDELEDD